MYDYEGFALSVDLQRQVVTEPDGSETGFEIEVFRKHRLLNGLDDIGLTLEHAAAIRDYEKTLRASSPWLFNAIQ
jgi:3-isopropylmalate/(R)-2-methylmalate dehydratase small subunit